MQVHHGSYLGLVWLGPMNAVVDRQKMFVWKFINPLDQQTLTAARFEARSRRRRCITPEARRLQVAVHLFLELRHRYAIVWKLRLRIIGAGPMPNRLGDLQPRQRIYELWERKCVELNARTGEIPLRVALEHRLARHSLAGHPLTHH